MGYLSRRLGLCLLPIAIGLFTRSAGAQSICFQPVGGVPPVYGQPPQWWTTGAPLGSSTGRWIDDPRWRGASSYVSLGDYGRFRVLVETDGGGKKFLVMSWLVKVDITGASDRLYVGFYNPPTNEGNVFRLSRVQDTATTVDGATYAATGFSGRFFYNSGAGWVAQPGAPPPLPTWLKNDTRVDVFCSSPTTCDSWAVRMRVPIDPAAVVTDLDPTGVKITGAQFRFWYEIQDSNSLGFSPAYHWPEGLAAATEAGGAPPIQFPDPSTWNLVDLSGACNGEISLDSSQIWANSSGSTTVNLSTPNNFHARPSNNVPTATATSLPGDGIKATFRLANWGSSIGASPAWQPICTDKVGTAGAITSGSQFDIVCGPWSVPDPCAFKPAGDPCGPTAGSKNPDQCVLVDLAVANTGDPARYFSPQSAYHNMSFTGASKIVKRATLDARGLPALGGGAPQRDLYVYIQTANMPAVVDNPPPPPPGGDRGQLRERLQKLEVAAPAKGRAIGSKEAERLQAAVLAGQLTLDDVAQVMPTYRAYVWYDTGRTVPIEGGGTRKLLEPQPSFGLFAWHDGDLTGWKHQLSAAGAVQLAPNLYKIPVPTNGTVDATVQIEALECSGILCTLPLWLIILLVLLLLVVLFFVLKKKTP
jgi:hypothetical protein